MNDMTGNLATQDYGPVLSTEFWSDLAPTLTCSQEIDLTDVGESDTTTGSTETELIERLSRDGAAVVNGAISAAIAERMRVGVESIRTRLGHEVFALIYDEFWQGLAGQRMRLECLMGKGVRAVPLPLVNYVPHDDAGFAPHRDRFSDPLAQDGGPNTMTVWIALTDAGTDRACLSVLPVQYDNEFPDNLTKLSMTDLRNVRALPVSQGDAVMFNQAIMHWGTRNVSGQTRVSYAMEVERAGAPDARAPFIELTGKVTLAQRVGFLGAVVAGLHRNNVDFSQEELSLARYMCQAVHGDQFDTWWTGSVNPFRLTE